MKVWLKPNELTADPTDKIAVLSSSGKIDKTGLIDALVEEGVEMRRETLEDVINRYNRKCAAYALAGWYVDSGLVYMHPVVTGPFHDKRFDPAKNSVYVSCVQGVHLRREAARTKVEVLGMLPEVMYITRVVNMHSRVSDCTLTRGRNAAVEGSYIKIAGGEPSVGVYLTNVETGSEIKLESDFLVTNEPSKLLLLIPAEMPAGTYRLKAVTQFTGANKMLKAPREAVYFHDLTVL